MSAERTVERLTAYEDRTARLMVSLALAFIVVYATEVLVVVMPGPLGLVLEVVSALIWFTFAVDLTIRVYLAPERLAAVKAKLAANRLTTPLFDTAATTRDLESLFDQAYGRYLSGLRPDVLRVAAV